MDTQTPTLTDIRPPQAWVERYVRTGAWRTTSIVDDLYRWAAATPDAPAIVAQHDTRLTRISYAEYAAAVDRYAGALRDLGVGPGQVVSLQMPNRWELPALLLAVWKVGAVAAPVMMTIGPRELQRMLARLGSTVCITVHEFDGVPHAERLGEITTQLPHVMRQVVLGEPGPGQLGFEQVFEGRAPEDLPADVDPDRVSAVLFTSGTTGEPKAALHTLNTLAFTSGTWARALGIGPEDRVFTPHAITHMAGIALQLTVPLRTGASALLVERWDPETAADLVVQEAPSVIFGAPVFLDELLEALDADLPGLRHVYSGATTIPRALRDEVSRRLGRTLGSVWAMTEVSLVFTRPGDPPSADTDAVGRPADGLDVTIAHEAGADAPGQLLVRGAGVCVATVARDSGAVDVIADRNDGWYETGDLAVSAGGGDYRVVGRAADRIGGAFMIPVLDVEDALREHPAVAEAALIGVPDGHGGEVACAVIQVAGETPPTLQELRAYLLADGMTEWYLPQQLEVIDELPRNATGKVEKHLLRTRVSAGDRVADGVIV
jgi:cyclohexanecarboxylate-CoA ligase